MTTEEVVNLVPAINRLFSAIARTVPIKEGMTRAIIAIELIGLAMLLQDRFGFIHLLDVRLRIFIAEETEHWRLQIRRQINRRDRTLRPGTILVREWNGALERVTVLDVGFAWNGTTYHSLSGVAFAITGTRWNGPRFFGLRGAAAAAGPAVHFQRVNSVAELDRAVRASAGKPVMLDFYADWCVSCKEMERDTFSTSVVKTRLDDMVALQADVTANLEEHKALLKRFDLFGPPGIILFDRKGNEIMGLRVIGFQKAEKFAGVLDEVLKF